MPRGIYPKEKRRGLFIKGQKPTNGMKGKKHSEITRKKMSSNRIGNKNPRWVVDRSKLVKNENKHLDTKYKYWMLSVKERDGWKCRLSNNECFGKLEAHHIFNWKENPTLRYVINNGISLCRFHHPRGRKKELEMIPILQELLLNSKV